MHSSKEPFVKNVMLILPPGDPGPICSYSPYCSSGDNKHPAPRGWRRALITMVASELVDIPENQERGFVRDWLLQLVRRELTQSLEIAEKQARYKLEIDIPDRMADLIRKALVIKGSGRKNLSKAPKKKTK